MKSNDLTERSPLRLLDEALDGGLGRGDLAVVLARHGSGKTPFLVTVALDRLFRGRRVLHVALDSKVDHARTYYDQIFAELTKGFESSIEFHLEMERGRRIHAYHGNTFSLAKLRDVVTFMAEHAGFTPDLMVVDGYDQASVADVKDLKALVAEIGAELWMSAVRHRDEPVADPDGIPAPVADYKDEAKIVLDLRTMPDGVRIRALKPRAGDGLLPFVLDPTTMLLVRRD